ncbi:MAG: hypothetical protein HN855_10350 [Anaerolineae bacterium]|nr:hypothetical protein [Anaerolineae bacterium]MBT7325552.1 hypothetical protein [Anaerolineae bacterium]
MKKFFVTVFVGMVLSGCSASFPKVTSYYVSPVCEKQLWGRSPFALSPDGQFVTCANNTFLEIDTGEELQLFLGYTLTPNEYMGLPIRSEWSSDNRYFGITTLFDDRTPGANRNPVYIVDTNQQTIKKMPDSIRDFVMWSPFKTGHFVSQYYPEKTDISDGFKLFDIQGNLLSTIEEEIDFQEEAVIGGNDSFLWSRELDRPIAFLEVGVMESEDTSAPSLSTLQPNTRICNLYIKSFAYPINHENPAYRVLVAENMCSGDNVDVLFDPTGVYLLQVQWERSDLETSDVDLSTVTDSVGTLINWKTGEKYELFRLSQFDTENVVASRPVAWSADGSTIFISRDNAPPLILKLDH